MKCSECQNNLEEIDFRGIKISECPKCRGRWFDRGELRKAKDNTDEDLRWIDFDPFGEDTEQFSIAKEGKQCPKCSLPRVSLAFEKSGVVIEKCSQCQGVWLQSGEFEKIIKYLENLVVTESASEYVIDSFKQFLEIVKGPEDKVSEVKDLLAVLKLLRLRIAVEHPNISRAADKIFQYLPFL